MTACLQMYFSSPAILFGSPSCRPHSALGIQSCVFWGGAAGCATPWSSCRTGCSGSSSPVRAPEQRDNETHPLEIDLDSPPPGAWSDHFGRRRTCCSRDRPAGGFSRGFWGLRHGGRFLGRARRRKGPWAVRCCLWRSLFRIMYNPILDCYNMSRGSLVL